MILLLGVVITVAGYLLLTDWQAIPYDPCTKYSPFHHPEKFTHHCDSINSTSTGFNHQSDNFYLNFFRSRFSSPHKVRLYSKVELSFNGTKTIHVQFLDQAILGTSTVCMLNPSCPLCEKPVPLHQAIQPCLVFEAANEDDDGPLKYGNSVNRTNYLLLSCSTNGISPFCINLYYSMHSLYFNENDKRDDALSDMQDSIASNSCINADVPGRQCHWIPFSTVTNTKCNDCPPICRAKEQTLNFVQFVLGLFLLVFGIPIFVIPLVALIADHSPKGSQVYGSN